MIRFWGREVIGWMLVFLGLFIFYICIALLLERGPEIIFDGPIYTVIGIFVFRGGIHLLKVAVAARVCMTAQTEPVKAAPPRKRSKKAETPWDW